MHPAEHRGLRELYVAARQLRDHWRSLAARLQSGAPAEAALLMAGSDLARGLIGELTDVTAARGLHGRPAAQGFGARLASVHSVLLDTALEVNQALRFAVLDVVHVVTLLDYLAVLADGEGDSALEAFLAGWAPRMRAQEEAIRAAAVALGAAPDASIAAAAPGLPGRVMHGAANVVGTLGEWVDGRAARK
ncbi:MAG TPA: hypothetical protein VL120_16600 [Solirubrobacteraceae bacterium]|nr:hypothetical protein [Solirubrobacteraceae bacterium]